MFGGLFCIGFGLVMVALVIFIDVARLRILRLGNRDHVPQSERADAKAPNFSAKWALLRLLALER